MATETEMKSVIDQSRKAFWTAMDASNKADDAVATAKRLAYEHPSHAALDLLESAERIQRLAMHELRLVADQDEILNRIYLQATGRWTHNVTAIEARFSRIQMELYSPAEYRMASTYPGGF